MEENSENISLEEAARQLREVIATDVSRYDQNLAAFTESVDIMVAAGDGVSHSMGDDLVIPVISAAYGEIIERIEVIASNGEAVDMEFANGLLMGIAIKKIVDLLHDAGTLEAEIKWLRDQLKPRSM